jgi:Xaa-Pro aminopeptidase
MAPTLGGPRMKKDEAEYAKRQMSAAIADRAMQTAFARI